MADGSSLFLRFYLCDVCLVCYNLRITLLVSFLPLPSDHLTRRLFSTPVLLVHFTLYIGMIAITAKILQTVNFYFMLAIRRETRAERTRRFAPRLSNLDHQHKWIYSSQILDCDGYSFALVGNEGSLENPRALQSTIAVGHLASSNLHPDLMQPVSLQQKLG